MLDSTVLKSYFQVGERDPEEIESFSKVPRHLSHSRAVDLERILVYPLCS